MPKQKRLTNRCSLTDAHPHGSPFIEDHYEICDDCILKWQDCEPFYEEVVVAGGGYIYEGVPTNQVVSAIRRLSGK